MEKEKMQTFGEQTNSVPSPGVTKPILPMVMDDESLFCLCRKYRAEIGKGQKKYLPKVRIRYVLDNKKFGYADFGDYFFWVDNGLYVWHREEEYAEDHNADVVEDFFGHDCEGRGYTCRHIFAGIDTGIDDSDGSRMFTGDIVQVTYPGGAEMGSLCLASKVGKDGSGFYGFPLDNHSLTLQMCRDDGYRLKRVGTIFYQLDNCDEPEPIWEKALSFNNNRWTKEELKQHLVMAQYTPNYYKEVWQYLGYEILGIEPFWNDQTERQMDMAQQKKHTLIPIGKIEEITDIRSVWPHEQYNFSEWLADNIEILNEATGMNLEVTDKELHVGSFRADIVCKDENVGKVVIENQLERTDHDHFGKIMTYAAGVDAGAVVWIAPTFTEPHLTAVKWLNDETGSNRQFFAIEIHLFKIGDSAPAPYLKVVAQPNEWRKVVKSVSSGDPKSQLEATRYSYWSCLSEYLQDKGYSGSLPKAVRTHYNNLSVGKSQIVFALTIDSVHNVIKTMVYLEGPKAKSRFDFLKEKCYDDGKKLFGDKLLWVDKEGNSTKSIEITANYNLNDEAKWKEQFEWFYQQLTAYNSLFLPYIKDLD